MAQYGIGHSTTVAQIRESVAGMSGLTFAGNAYTGVGVPDCVRSGSEAAVKVLSDIGISTSAIP
jgi:oxygen-dependent protoporphyrinogen oxidase